MAAGSFGSALRQARERQGISLAGLARLVHYNTGYLSRVERGERRPSIALALSCDEALGADGELARLISQAAPKAGAAWPRPAQIPAGVAGFTGRAAALAELDAAVDDSAATVAISAIGGMAGIGKTALAVHFAHRVADRFPDGQLYVNLRGLDQSGQPVTPATAVRGFLDALEVPATRIPTDPDAQAGLYRSLLAGRRMLILADNARDAAQVRPLLPGTPGCLVLVTSRHQLASLAATEGARLIGLDVLTTTEARGLLAARIGQARVAAEPRAVTDIIAGCGRLPLALAIVAARAAAHPGLPLSGLAAELAEQRLDALATRDDPAADVRAVFSWSYHALRPEAARLFRLLGLHPGPDISASAAASLAGLPLPRARVLLAELTAAHLISEHRPGRHAPHDLLRAYAAELASQIDTDDQCRAATRRMLDHYLRTAHTAAPLVHQDPAMDPVALPPSAPGVTPEPIACSSAARAWFQAEHQVLLAVIRYAQAAGWNTHASQLPTALKDYLAFRGHWHDLAAAQRVALDAAGKLADPKARARAHLGIGGACGWLARYDDASEHMSQALDLFEGIGDGPGQALAHMRLGWILERQGRPAEALRHPRQALALYQDADHLPGQARALNAIGWLHAQLGDHHKALTYCQQALDLHSELSDALNQAFTLDSVGYASYHLGYYQDAAICYRQALALLEECGDLYHQATALAHLGDAIHATGDLAAARDAWQQALDILDDLGHPDAIEVRAKLATSVPSSPVETARDPATDRRFSGTPTPSRSG